MPRERIPGAARKVAFTPAARGVLAAVCRRDGQQAVLLAWPAGAAYLPVDHYLPNAFDVILGHVEGCPVYADTRRLALFRNSQVIIDAAPGSPSPRHPTLSARTLTIREADCGMATPPAAVEPLRVRPGQALLGVLAAQFARMFFDGQISTCVRNAINDLRGSVSPEALPEMAARLAHHRQCAAMRPKANVRNSTRGWRVDVTRTNGRIGPDLEGVRSTGNAGRSCRRSGPAASTEGARCA